MPTRNVVLTAHQSELVEALVASGRYQNASEVLREGIRLVEQREAQVRDRIAAFRAAIAAGDADVEAGRSKVFKGPALRRHVESVTRSALKEAAGRRRK